MNDNKTNNTIQAFWVGIGSLCAFGVSLVSTMILSRYFDKADYGTYRQVLYVYQTLLAVFTLGLPKAYSYFLPRIEEECAKSLIKKVTFIFYLLGGLFSVLLFVLSPQIAALLKNPDVEEAMKIFSPVPFLLLPTMGLEGIFASYQKNRYMAIYNVVTKTLVLLCVSLPVIFFDGTYKDALVGFVIASFFSYLVANYLKCKCIRFEINKDTSISYKEILHFSLPLLFASLWGILAVSTDKFYISHYFGQEVFAEFSNGSLQLPFVGMIIGACSTVLMPLFSRKMHECKNPQSEILPIWKSVFEKTIKITYPLVLFSLFFADYIMILLYGNQYANSGIYFAIMLIVNFFTVISYFPILIAIGASRFYSRVQMFGALYILAFGYLSILIFRSPYAMTVISVSGTIIMVFVMLSYIAKFFSIGLFQLIPIKLCFKIIIPSICFLLVIRLVLENWIAMDGRLLLILLVAFFVYALLYVIGSVILRIDYASMVKPLISKLIK